MNYQGSCHCGQTAYEVDGELTQVMVCNCSICARKGAPLWFVARDQLRVIQGEDKLAAYTFNKHKLQHKFCPVCGIHPYAEGADPAGNRMAAINVRCLQGVNFEALPVKHFDGRSI
jgi:hypothetical protein